MNSGDMTFQSFGGHKMRHSVTTSAQGTSHYHNKAIMSIVISIHVSPDYHFCGYTSWGKMAPLTQGWGTPYCSQGQHPLNAGPSHPTRWNRQLVTVVKFGVKVQEAETKYIHNHKCAERTKRLLLQLFYIYWVLSTATGCLPNRI
jgi:hypothetical protein